MNSELTKKLELKSAELEKFIHMVDANQSTISMLQMQINQVSVFVRFLFFKLVIQNYSDTLKPDFVKKK